MLRRLVYGPYARVWGCLWVSRVPGGAKGLLGISQDIPHKALRSLSCLRLSGHEFQVQIQRYNQGVPYEQRV